MSQPNTPQDIPIANPGDFETVREGHGTSGLFLMQAGAYGDTRVYVWADHLEDAWEEMIDWLGEHAPGLLTTFSESDYREAAEDLKLPWLASWPDHEDSDFQKVAEKTEVDHSVIGHTTLDCGATHMANWEWNYADPSPSDFAIVRARSQREGHVEFLERTEAS